ncbi:Uncharacterised protein [Anaerobiospirillum thomasii]|uniref:hypothetical protein n=1 Tax=Anaerobiospirillum thomasii TaxID=179995 RepID=UPI000DA098A1|nr:hypothetical protein [Anaerobiospirillum thomasii]SPT71547.1 Uncharacterised protein [Anaerobiospirillum thomasii]
MKPNEHDIAFKYELINDTTAYLYIGNDKEPFTSVKIDKGTSPIGMILQVLMCAKEELDNADITINDNKTPNLRLASNLRTVEFYLKLKALKNKKDPIEIRIETPLSDEDNEVMLPKFMELITDEEGNVCACSI